ncbi:MAG: glycosyl hydrolase 115 family protein [Akkermansiaceae bacterium]|jgi:hypothetical protein|nr:glycosyl hydrolase 115 family protein [Akkermansiaceae bacterium]
MIPGLFSSTCLILLAFLGASAAAVAGEYVTGTPAADRFPLADAETTAGIHVSENDWKVAEIAAADLAADVERVTGRRPELNRTTDRLPANTVLIGTIGRSRAIDGLIAAGKLDVGGLAGQWESFVIEMVADPLPGVARGLVIAGSDRRGTAYGVYELSRRIGVSPWYWWADVTPQRRNALHVSAERLRVGPPAVKYRGIFINDEMWGIRPWAEKTFAPDEGRGLGPKTHAKIFELLLRLRANHLWPAMHRDTIPFNTYPRNKQVADDYAIVMGSSHIEPMLRNNMHGAEWDREGGGDWNYLTNRDAILRYWERRIQANGRYENLYTLGMRGKDDEPMYAGGTLADRVALLERIFRDQRSILTRHIDPDPAKIPQVFIPYTEVLGMYEAGMKVPDDVILCWPDDNFGYLRRLPTEEERKRPGGSGVYYHLQWLNGATTAYTWLNTMPLALMATEMHKAWQYGADKLWVLNVGDIKPAEIGTEFFLDMAWNPAKRLPGDTRSFLTEWAARDLDERLAGEIAAIIGEYYQLGFTRRPEHLVQYRKDMPLEYSWFSHDHFGDEAERRLERYEAIANHAERIHQEIPIERKDAFFQLVLYPVSCAALINEKVICADKSMHHAARGRAVAAAYARRAEAAAARIIDLTDHYNDSLPVAGAKWRHMMSPAPGPWGNQRHQFEMPPLGRFDGAGPPALDVAAEGGQAGVVADLSVYTRGRRFIDLFNKGTGGIEWRAIPTEPWLTLDQQAGRFTKSQRLWVSVDWSSAPKGTGVEGAIEITGNGGSARVRVPVFHPAEPSRDQVAGFVESHGCVSMEAEHFTRRRDQGGAAWRVVKGLGRSGDSVTVFPATAASRTGPEEILSNSPALEYDMHLFSHGELELHIDCLPGHPVAPGRGVRLAVGVDGAAPVILAGPPPRYPQDVLTNLRRFTTTLAIDRPGRHTLAVWMVDPGVIIDKITLHTRKPVDSYLGPPESFRR